MVRSVQPELARKTWRTLEPIHGLIYFAPEATEAYAALGVTGRSGYFASRSAPMGAVPADVVIATFWTTAHGVAALSPRKGAKAIFVQGYETSPGQENPAIDAVWRLRLHKIVISNWLVAWAKEHQVAA